MGQSTDGILCYGFRLRQEDGQEEGITIEWLLDETGNEEMDLEDFLAKLCGLVRPDVHFNKERSDKDPDYKKAWDDYFDTKFALKKEVGVTIVSHGSENCFMQILASTESVKTASRGNPIELGQSIEAQGKWREDIRLFCEKAEIPFEEPQFILCSDWSW